jgi:GT2 family glycosyltransferase
LSADIAAIVVTYRSAETIALCLQRLLAAAGVAAVRVVDNGSDDGTLEIVARIASMDPRLRFIANPGNPGFAVACNQGASDVDAAWLAFVNPDCLVEPDTLLRLRESARGLGPALLGADLVDEEGVRDGAARRRDPDFGAMLAGVIGRVRATDLALAPSQERLQRVDAVSGALMLMPRSLFVRIGGFDEGYRLHAEDLDLCRRAREAGATIAVDNGVRVVHVRGVSSRSRPVFVEWHKHRGLWRYFRKFEAARRGPLTRVLVPAAIALRFVLAAARAWWRARA